MGMLDFGNILFRKVSIYALAMLVLTGTLFISGCIDKNPVDEQSDKVLEQISNGEFKDADGTMHATLYKQAMDASGQPTLDIVSQNVKVVKFEVLPDGTSSVTYTSAAGGEEKQEILGPGNTMIVKSKDGKQYMILGAQEMDGWKVVTSPKITLHRYGEKDEEVILKTTPHNDNIIGNSDHEIYVTLSKENGEMMVNLFMSTDWYLYNLNSNRNGGSVGGTFHDMSSKGEVNVPSEELYCFVTGGVQLVKGYEDIAFKQFPLSVLKNRLPGVDNIVIKPDAPESANPDAEPTPYGMKYYLKNLDKGMPRIDVQNTKGWNTKGAFE